MRTYTWTIAGGGQGRTKRAFALVLGVALALVAVLGVVPREALADGTKAYAAYDVTTDENKSKSGDALTALQVTFNGKQWYVIEDGSTAANAGTLTLLAADNIATGQKFNSDKSKGNMYSQSDVIGVLKAMTETGDFKDVAGAIVTIGSLETKGYNSDQVSDTAQNVKLYLLSTQEAGQVPQNVRKAGFSWWLRSPGYYGDGAAVVTDGDGNVYGWGYNVNSQLGVRPALKLNLNSVIFESQSKTFSLRVNVTGVTLNPSTAQTIDVGGKVTLTATVEPDGATDKTVTWSSSNTGVATVDENGVVTGVAPGTATITCTATNGTADTSDDKTATCEVTVTAETPKPTIYKVSVAQAEGGTVSADKSEAAEGETVAVTATPGDGWELEAVTVDGEAIEGTTFAMPARDVTVSVRFAKKGGPQPEPEPTGALKLAGAGHVQGTGDVAATEGTDGIVIGTTGQSKRLEQFSVALPEGTDGSIEYRGHLQGIGWDGWVKDGAPCGTTGQSRRIEAVQMTLTGAVADDYSVWYRVHSQTFGWLGWARDGQAAGTAGQSRRAEAIEVQVLPSGQVPGDYAEGQASYVGAATADVHVQGTGWAGSGSALEFGTTGQSRRLEAISFSTPNQPEAGGISYEVHAQGIGWMGAVADGALAGTTGQSRRLEAVRVSLTGDMAAGFSVWYRVHSQTYGWLGWAHDGQDAGTTGLSKRAEAIDVQILPQGQVPAGYDGSAACIVG